MPRNGSGVFSIINPVLIGAFRSSSAVNANFTDMGAQITNSLPVDAQAAMTGPLKLANGQMARPAFTFKPDTNVGFYRRSADTMAWVSGGQDRFYIDATGKAWGRADLDAAGNVTTHGSFSGDSNIGNLAKITDTGRPRRVGDNDWTTDASQVEVLELCFDLDGRPLEAPVVMGDLRIPFDCTLTAASIVADVVGTCSVDVWRDSFANFPPTIADTIVGAHPLTLTGQSFNGQNPLSGWLTTVTAGDVIRFYLTSTDSVISRLVITLAATRAWA